MGQESALGSLLAVLILFVFSCVVAAQLRRRVLPPTERFSINFLQLEIIQKAFPRSEKRADKLLSVILVLSVITLAGTVGYTIALPPKARGSLSSTY